MGDNQEVNMVYNVAIALANSGLSDSDLLYIADAVYAAEFPNDSIALEALARHKNHAGLSCHLVVACKQRSIDTDTGTKVTTSTIDLLV
jgi:hypothetical protein